MNFLDKTGVGLLWSICKTKFALKNHSHNYLPLSGGTLTGDLLFSDSGTTFRQIKGTCGGNDFWRIGGGATAESAGFMEIATAENATEPIYVRQYIGVFATIKRTATLLDANGNTSFPGIVAAAKFKGALEGNASTASNASKVNGHTVNADVPSGAKFTDTNIWRGIQDNLTSTSTSDSLSANQGKVLKGLVDGKANSSHTHTWSQVTGAPSTATRWPSWGEVTGKPSSFTPSSHTHDDRYYTESEINSKLAAKAVNITLDANVDLNKIIAPGFYNCGGSNNVLNKPSGVNAIGLIVTHNASGSFYTQILTTDSKDTYRRTCLNGTWSAWTQDKYTDTNTWRGIQNNLTSNSTSDSLSAAQGKVLKGLIDGKANSSDLSSYAQKSQAIASIDIIENYYNDQKYIRPRFYIQKADGDESTLDIEDASTKKSGLMSCYDKSKLDGIQAGANKYTLPVASSTTLGGIKVATKATGTQWPICIDGNGIAYAHINGLSQSYDNSIDSLLVVDSDDHSAKYGYNGIDIGMSDSASHHIDFPSKPGTFALTSDCLSSKKGSVYPGSANGFSINFTSAQQIVLLDTSGNYSISDWYDYSSIGNVLDMYPCGLMGGKLSSGGYKNLFKVMKMTQGGPKLTSIDSFDLQYNIHVRLIHIDNGVLVCPYTLNY